MQRAATVELVAETIGIQTNNVAEYRALLAALEIAERVGAERVEIVSDSELLVKQMRGEYKVKNEGLRPLYEEAQELAREFHAFLHQARRAKRKRQSRRFGQQSSGRTAEGWSIIHQPRGSGRM